MIEHGSLEGQAAIITGGTSGLGRAIAVKLAAGGATVVIVGRSLERGRQVVDEIEAAGGRASFIPADLGRVDEIQRVARTVGDVDILVNNVGHAVYSATESMAVDDFDSMFHVNVRSAYFMVAAFAPAMAERGSGSIINVGSMAGTIGLAGAAAYGATKAALVSLAQSWTAEYSPRGVRVNTVAPGPVYTRIDQTELFDRLGATTAMKRAGQPSEIAEVVAFLASSKASYVTGATFAIDGGRTAI